MNSEIKNSEQGKKETLMRVPELRFPEFCDEKEWQEKQLQSICQMKAGKFISASKINQHPAEGLYPCYGGNGLRGFTGEYSHSGEYSLIGRQGALCGNITFANGDFYATEHAVVVTP
ncbi:TPA: restriction endonuclease subunit S, partial [Yersinia enterocolitica]|nr:restriction endonuclease subunit S [Yersinia enterocolitica]